MEYLIWELGERSVGEASQARLQSRGSSQGRVWSKGPGPKEGGKKEEEKRRLSRGTDECNKGTKKKRGVVKTDRIVEQPRIAERPDSERVRR